MFYYTNFLWIALVKSLHVIFYLFLFIYFYKELCRKNGAILQPNGMPHQMEFSIQCCREDNVDPQGEEGRILLEYMWRMQQLKFKYYIIPLFYLEYLMLLSVLVVWFILSQPCCEWNGSPQHYSTLFHLHLCSASVQHCSFLCNHVLLFCPLSTPLLSFPVFLMFYD